MDLLLFGDELMPVSASRLDFLLRKMNFGQVNSSLNGFLIALG